MFGKRCLYRYLAALLLSGMVVFVYFQNKMLQQNDRTAFLVHRGRAYFKDLNRNAFLTGASNLIGNTFSKVSTIARTQSSINNMASTYLGDVASTLSLRDRISKIFPDHNYSDMITDNGGQVFKRQSYCPNVPATLHGQLNITPYVRLEDIWDDEVIQNVRWGGVYNPPDCKSQEHVAIIVPYRDRYYHLEIFLMHMHTILQRQNLAYAIYIVEMAYPTQFNRGLLTNAGFLTASSIAKYTCYIIHDVDLLPANDKNMYKCALNPKHMSTANSKFLYSLPYEDYTGGVVALTRKQFRRINGFPNVYFGWGGEDDDVAERIAKAGYNIERVPNNIGIYEALNHGSDSSNPKNPHRFNLQNTASSRMKTDGLLTARYTRLAMEFRQLYTWVYVGADEKAIIEVYQKDLGILGEPPDITKSPFKPNEASQKALRKSLLAQYFNKKNLDDLLKLHNGPGVVVKNVAKTDTKQTKKQKKLKQLPSKKSTTSRSSVFINTQRTTSPAKGLS